MLNPFRSPAAKKKAGVFALLGALWQAVHGAVEKFAEWFVDKVFGEAAFNRLKAELDSMLGPEWQDALWSWGPTLLLCGAGVYLLLRGDGPRAAGAVADPPAALFSVTFHNHTPVKVHLYRTTPDGTTELVRTMEPLSPPYGTLTHVGQQWVAKDAEGRELKHYVAAAGADRTVMIESVH